MRIARLRLEARTTVRQMATRSGGTRHNNKNLAKLWLISLQFEAQKKRKNKLRKFSVCVRPCRVSWPNLGTVQWKLQGKRQGAKRLGKLSKTESARRYTCANKRLASGQRKHLSSRSLVELHLAIWLIFSRQALIIRSHWISLAGKAIGKSARWRNLECSVRFNWPAVAPNQQTNQVDHNVPKKYPNSLIDISR